jgi:hypothetical protein
MKIEEAIKHCREVASRLECSACGAEHTQLAAWLEELQMARELLSKDAQQEKDDVQSSTP